MISATPTTTVSIASAPTHGAAAPVSHAPQSANGIGGAIIGLVGGGIAGLVGSFVVAGHVDDTSGFGPVTALAAGAAGAVGGAIAGATLLPF